MTNIKVIYTLNDIETVVKHHLQPLLKSGCIFLLQGQLGAGKTTLVKAIGRFLGIEEKISSPTFGYYNKYVTNQENFLFYHFDLYRINSIDEIYNYGFDEIIFDTNSITIIEWPEVLHPLLQETQKPVLNKKPIFFLKIDHDLFFEKKRVLLISKM